MVAAKRGRGARSQAAKAKPAEEAPAAAPAETSEAVEQEVPEPAEASSQETMDTTEGEQSTEDATAEAEPEKKEKEEPGKLLVENLPSSLLFDYQEKVKEIFSKHGEIVSVKRGPIIVTELTTTPTLSAIVEFKNKDSLEKALIEDKTFVGGSLITVAAQPSTVDTTVLVGVPFEASNEYVRLLFGECGPIAQIQEFSKTKYKILRVTFETKECLDKAMKLDRELRINGFLVTVTKYREDQDNKPQINNLPNKNKRVHRASGSAPGPLGPPPPVTAPRALFRGRSAFPNRPPFRGGRGRGAFGGRGTGGFRPGGFGDFPGNSFGMPHGGFMGRGGYLNDGQRPNKRLRQM